MKRFLSLLTAFALVLSMMPMTFAAQAVTVYLDPVNGGDTNNGLSETAPVQSLTAAYALLENAGGTVVFLDTLTLTEALTLPACSYPVTLTSKTGAEGIATNNHIFFGGDTTLENITLTLNADNNTTYLSAEGHDLTIGEGVTCVNSSTYRFCLTARHGAGSVDGAVLTVKSGTWRNIFLGGYTSANTGSATLFMSGGNVNNLVSPTYKGTLEGNTTMHITGGTIGCLEVGANATGSVTGNIDITLGGGTVKKVRMPSGRPVDGTATLIVDGDWSGVTNFEESSGKINKRVLVLKSGTLATNPATYDEVRVEIPEGKTLTLKDCNVTADTVNSAGTLIFSGAASLTAAAVTGSLNCQISGTPEEGHTYITAPAGTTVTFPADSGVTGENGKWKTPGAVDENTFKGLVVRAEKGVKISLYSNYKANTGTLQSPTYTVEDGNQVSYYYPGASGPYRCVASRTGYYKLTKNIYMSEEEANTCTEQIIELDERASGTATDGWELSNYQEYTDEVFLLDAFNDDISQWKDYADVFTTPWFTESHGAQQQTTQTQRETFLFNMDGKGEEKDNMYIFSMGKSAAYNHDVWAVFFTETDLSSATSAEEAAELMGQDKPTVLYRAQVHGNEPAAGEAALAVVQRLDGNYGNDVLQNINVVIVPRANPDGARNFARTLASGVDPNRDQLRLESQEITDYLKLYQLVKPELVIDGHEYSSYAASNYFWDSDITVGLSYTGNNTQNLAQENRALAQGIFDAAEKNGLTYNYYGSRVNSYNDVSVSRPYFGQQGCLSILLETRGNSAGMVTYARRVIAQVVSVEYLLNYASDNAEEMQELVDAERKHIVDNGKTYRTDDLIYLYMTSVPNEEATWELDRIYQDGSVKSISTTPGIVNNVLRSRVAPTAYVIPAGESFTADVLALMDKQGICYEYIPADAQVYLRQYTGTTTQATLTEESLVTFANGAYVFTMNQVPALILAALMEPDMDDVSEYSGTLAQQGLVTADAEGYFPIYRYVRDLNAEGTIDYQMRRQEKTVYVSAATGADTNDGSQAAPLQTLDAAYALLSATADVTHGIIVLQDDYTLTADDILDMPAHSYHVTITGSSNDVVLTYYPTNSAKHSRVWNFNGPTTIDNLVLHHAKNNASTLVANGHSFVIGENVVTTSVDEQWLILAGGSYQTSCVDADLTVLAGTWRNVYAGSYQGARTGDVKLTMRDCTVINHIQNAYSGAASGSLVVELTNVKANTIFCGNAGSGNVSGEVTLILHEDVTATAIYTGSRDAGNMTGTVNVVIDGADMTALTLINGGNNDTCTVNKAVVTVISGIACPIAGFDEVNLNTSSGGTVTLATDMTFDNVTGGKGKVDLNGKNITCDISAQEAALLVADSQTDDYTVADGKYGKLTGTLQNVAAAEGYMMATEDGGVSFHKVDTEIAYAIFSPTKAGLYYSSLFKGDEIVKENVKTFGVALSISAIPTADSNGIASHCQYSVFEQKDFQANNEEEFASTVLTDILSEKYGTLANGRNAATKVYGRSYIQLTDGTYVLSVATSVTLQAAIEYTDSVWTQLEKTQQDAVLALYERFPAVFNNWNIPTIKELAGN